MATTTFETTVTGSLVTIAAQATERDSATGLTVGATIAVHVYWHTPTDGRAPYLVVEVDDNDTDHGLVVALNDADLYRSVAASTTHPRVNHLGQHVCDEHGLPYSDTINHDCEA